VSFKFKFFTISKFSFFHTFTSRKLRSRSKKIVLLTVKLNHNIRVQCCSHTARVVGYFIFAVELLFINLGSGMNDAANREMSAKFSTEHITASIHKERDHRQL
jgi:hypothetical protein